MLYIILPVNRVFTIHHLLLLQRQLLTMILRRSPAPTREGWPATRRHRALQLVRPTRAALEPAAPGPATRAVLQVRLFTWAPSHLQATGMPLQGFWGSPFQPTHGLPSPSQRMELALDTHALLDRSERAVVVSVSGGVDSVALLHCLWHVRTTRNLQLHVLHFNHRLRPEADDEEALGKPPSLVTPPPSPSWHPNLRSFATHCVPGLPPPRTRLSTRSPSPFPGATLLGFRVRSPQGGVQWSAWHGGCSCRSTCGTPHARGPARGCRQRRGTGGATRASRSCKRSTARWNPPPPLPPHPNTSARVG